MALGIFGNEQYGANHTLQNVATTGTAWAAYMWTAPANLTISNVMVAIRERATITQAGGFKYSIRTGTVAGPTGADLCNLTVTFVTGGAATLSRWQTVDFTDLAVSGGNTYCIVIAPVSAAMGARGGCG